MRASVGLLITVEGASNHPRCAVRAIAGVRAGRRRLRPPASARGGRQAEQGERANERSKEGRKEKKTTAGGIGIRERAWNDPSTMAVTGRLVRPRHG